MSVILAIFFGDGMWLVRYGMYCLLIGFGVLLAYEAVVATQLNQELDAHGLITQATITQKWHERDRCCFWLYKPIHCDTANTQNTLRHTHLRLQCDYSLFARSPYLQALELIRRLDRPTQARLVAEIVKELAAEPVISPKPTTDPRVALAEVRAYFAKLGPVSPTAGKQAEQDRQSRADMIEGVVRDSDEAIAG